MRRAARRGGAGMNAEEKDLLHRHLNGDLDASEQAAFFGRLQSSPELRRELASHAMDEMLISELVLEGRTAVRAPARRRTWIPLGVAAAMLLGLTAILTRGRSEQPTLRVASVEGSVVVRRGDGETPLRVGGELQWGDRIISASGRATIEIGGLRIALARESSMLLRGGKSGIATLEKGGLQAENPGGQLLLTTPHAEVQTHQRRTLRLEVNDRRSRIEAEDGPLEICPRPSGTVIRIDAGEYALLGKSVERGRVISSKRVDQAAWAGCAFLASRRSDLVAPMTSEKRHGPAPRRTYAELALLALHRSGIPDSEPLKVELLGSVRGRSVDSTYGAALQAMALAEIDPIAHHDRLRLCAQLLVDSQCRNGQWDYAVKLAVPDVPTTGRIRRRSEGPAAGDNSVASYAVLGLHACSRAGVEIDPDVLARARAWWLQCQNADGGWGYNDADDRVAKDASRRTYTTDTSYGSATASGVASLAAIRDLLHDPRSDDAIRRGMEWLGANFSVDRNPRKDPGFVHLHWLITAARAGAILGTDHFGAHDWYAEGADFLLKAQRPSGEWTVEQGDFMKAERNDVLDTCLAILFLRRDR